MKPPAFVDCYGELAVRLVPDMLSQTPDLEVYRSEPADENELIARLQGRRNALVYMGYLSARVLRACPDLRTVAYLSTGLATHADLEEADHLGVRIEGVKGYGDRAVAEHTIALAFAALKRVSEGDRMVRGGGWSLLQTEEISGKTFGLLGLGGIGRETARLAAALGANVIAWTRSGNPGDSGAELAPLEEVIRQSDILSLHLALTTETESFMGPDEIAAMKPGAILINTARGGLVDETALVAALQSGALGHCALDVFHQEPLSPDSPLQAMDNVTLTPHSAWYTTQSIDRLLVAGLDLLRRHIAETG